MLMLLFTFYEEDLGTVPYLYGLGLSSYVFSISSDDVDTVYMMHAILNTTKQPSLQCLHMA